MAQLTLYMDEETLKRIEKAAQKEHQSISMWVKNRLKHVLQTRWPEHYFELMGLLKKEKLTRPKQLSFARDTRRMKI